MNSNAIEIKNLTKIFTIKKRSDKAPSIFHKNFINQNLTALNDISFSIRQGQVIGIIGLNGSGKSTLLKTISGIYTPDSGSIKITGLLAPVLQIGSSLQPQLNLQENIMIYGMLLGLSKTEIKNKIPEILEFADLTKFAGNKLQHLSSGMKIRLSFSIMNQVKSDIILLDEVLAVGDALFRKKCSESINSFKENGKTIILTTHNLNILPDLCDKVLFLHKGKLVMLGNPDETIKKFREIVKLRN